ncbi:MAG TPA: hypothetical protein VK468_11170 [Pyrinomonadaceae bacterium]|nr:hypothetical protein [Pyrinomonadaceae bacterium]
MNSMSSSTAAVDAREPEQYQATVKLSLATTGDGDQKASLPTLAANVARAGNDRMMEFNLPTNEKVIFLDKGGVNYLILPNRKQYAELSKEALGFDIRRLLMPDQMVNQAKAMPGVKLVGEETMNGRQVVKYSYQASSNTQTQAGTVETESYMLVDKETGLPLRTETVSQSQSGLSVQGVNGVRVVTEMTDISTSPNTALFALPTDFQKIDPETVKAQVNLIFQVVGNIIGQAINNGQARPASNVNAVPVPTASPAP